MNLYEVRNKLNMGITINDINLRVTYYSRVSTEHMEQKKSLKNQIEYFEDYIKKNKNWIYVKGYVDDGITGTSDVKRNNFMKMIDDAKKGMFDLIITKEISRFSRNTLDSIKYTRLLLEYDVFVLFLNDNINTAFSDSELRLTIMASMAQDEVRRLSDRVKFGMNRAIIRGEILGNNKLYGYFKNKNSGNLEIIESEALVVRKIYELYVLEDFSFCKIVSFLNDTGYRTRDGNKWSVATISRMVRNPKYKGYYCGKKSEVVNYMSKKVRYFDEEDWVVYKDNKKIPSIVSDYLWDRANDKVKVRKKRVDKVISYKINYLFSGKLFCFIDGKVFNRRLFRKNSNEVTWVCSRHLNEGSKVCDSPNLREVELVYIFNDLLIKIGLNKKSVVGILIDFYNKYLVRNCSIDIDKYKNNIKILRLKKDKLVNLVIEGILTNDEFVVKNNMIDKEINDNKNEIYRLVNDNDLDFKNYDSNLLSEYLDSKVDDNIILKKIFDLILSKVIVRKISNNEIGLDIYFNYGINLDNKYIFSGDYEFSRGYDVVGTKRYKVFYKVNCYIN